ncbi:tetratricopeptide repeat protein [Flavisericum labens]|uniref:tetratricopeptide repeat protein n=1 Tax=Flavisericum labens TaxID=3377112 RepID=UPI00387A8A15
MKPLKHIAVALTIILLASCGSKEKQITNREDYANYLHNTESEMLQLAKSDLNFWEKKLEKEPNQFPYFAKAAASQSQIFNQTGEIEALIKAEKYLIKANEATSYNKAGYLRALARNYISQHRFKEALGLLKKAEDNGENLKGTQKMLFDVHMELGNFDIAKTYLEKTRKDGNFDYLIRLSKWSDHRGNLEAAIKYMEQAKTIAESSNVPSTKQWVYTNLADYYGHAGKIQDSYQHYLKALELNPEDAYAKKGIAWIVYSYEKNGDEALHILNTITKNHKSPDYYLLKAEIAEFKNDQGLKEEQLQLYAEAVKNPFYGDMYNKHNTLLLAEDPNTTAKALMIANEEIQNRPTPQSYDLLAWTHYNHGKTEEALKVMENHVVGKTSEPDVLFHLAKIYKANNKIEQTKKLKKELLESSFELGPITAQEIQNL